MTALGKHALIDYYDCDPEILKNPGAVREIVLQAIRLSGTPIIVDNFHAFEPHGVSGVVVIAESHVTIHTWPEYAYAALDVFTCGESTKCEIIKSAIKENLKAKRVSVDLIERGCFLTEHLKSSPQVPHQERVVFNQVGRQS